MHQDASLGTSEVPETSSVDTSSATEEDEPDARSLDGDTKSCEVHSDKSGNDYDIDVDFHGTYATLNFSNGGRKDVDLDDPDTNDLHNIGATDSDGESWEINVTDAP